MVDLQSYLHDGEEAIEESPASVGDSTGNGELVCTPQRLVFTQGQEVIDIDADRVDAIKFKGPTYPRSFVFLAGMFVVLALLVALLDTLAPEVSTTLAGAFGALGVITFLAGFFMRRETLEVHTGASAFTFKAKGGNLEAFPGAVRRDL